METLLAKVLLVELSGFLPERTEREGGGERGRKGGREGKREKGREGGGKRERERERERREAIRHTIEVTIYKPTIPLIGYRASPLLFLIKL